MQTRRDQLHAYRFLTKRALAALVTGEPNAVEPPMRRLTLTTVSGVMIAILVAVGFAVFGLIKPSAGDSWKDQGAVIIERQTGDHYIYRGGQLLPVLNYTSAVLAVSNGGSATSAVKVVLVDRDEIADTPRGPMIGIDGVPASLPDSSAIVNSPWVVCSRQHPASATTLQASVSVAVGDGVVRTSLLGTDQAVLVDTPSAPGDDYLLWEGKRFAIASEAITSALRIDDSTPLTVGTAFLQSLDAGTALDTPTIAGLGEPGPEIDGHPTQVGQLLRGDSNGEFSVVLADGVQSVNDLEAALLRTVHAPSELTVASNAIVSAKQSAKDGPALLDGAFHGLPAQLPTVADKPRELGDVCAVFTDDPDQQPRFAVAPSQLPNFEVTTVTESCRLGGRSRRRGHGESGSCRAGALGRPLAHRLRRRRTGAQVRLRESGAARRLRVRRSTGRAARSVAAADPGRQGVGSRGGAHSGQRLTAQPVSDPA